MNPYEVSKDPFWHSLVTGLVVFAMGTAAGVLFMGYLLSVQPTSRYQVVNTIPPSPNSGQVELNIGDASAVPIVVEEL